MGGHVVDQAERTFRFPKNNKDFIAAGRMLRMARAALVDTTTMRSASLRSLSEALGVSYTMAGEYEKGASAPSEKHISTVAKVYRVDENELRVLYGQPREREIEWLRKSWEKKILGD